MRRLWSRIRWAFRPPPDFARLRWDGRARAGWVTTGTVNMRDTTTTADGHTSCGFSIVYTQSPPGDRPSTAESDDQRLLVDALCPPAKDCHDHGRALRAGPDRSGI